VATDTELAPVQQAVTAALSDPAFTGLAAALDQAGFPPARCIAAVHAAASQRSLAPLRPIEAAATAAGADTMQADRYCLLQALAPKLERFPSLALPPDIARLLLKEFLLIAQPDAATQRFLQAHSSALLTLAKLTSLTRFPAGCFHAEYSGIPRSFLLKTPVRDWPRLAALVLFQLRGLKPCFEVHMNPRIRLLREADGLRAYQRMAQLMELHPEVKALVGFSWLRSPDNHRISPHLRWINEVVVRNGGYEAVIGEAASNSGVFSNSQSREQLAQQGVFKPTVGMVIWPRAEFLGWARTYSPA